MEVLKILVFEVCAHSLYCVAMAYLLLGCWEPWPKDHGGTKPQCSASAIYSACSYEIQKGDPLVGLLQPCGLIVQTEMEWAPFSHAGAKKAPGS